MIAPFALRWRLPNSTLDATAALISPQSGEIANLAAIVADLQLRVAALEAGNVNPAINAALSQTLGAVALTARAAAPLTASLANTLGSTALTATTIITSGNIASLTATLGAVSFSGSTQVGIGAALSNTLGATTLAATATAPLTAALSQTLGTVALSATVTVSTGLIASLAQTLGPVALTSTASAPLTASLSQTLGAVTLTGTAGLPAASYIGPVANNTMLPVGTQAATSGAEQSLIHPVRLGVAGATCSDVRVVLARALGSSGLLPASYTVNSMWARINSGAWSYQVKVGGSGSFTVTSWAGNGGSGDLPYLETDVIAGLTITHADDLEIFAYVTSSALPVWSGTNLEAMYTDEGFLETSGTTTPRRVTNPTDTLRRNRMQIITGIVGTTTADTYAHVGDSIGAASSGNLGDGSFAGHVRGVVASTLAQKYGVLNLSIGGQDPGQDPAFYPELRKAYLAYVNSAVWGQGINLVFNKIKTAAEGLSATKRALPLLNGKRVLIQTISPTTTDSTGNTARSYARSIGTTWTTDYNTLIAAAYSSTPVLPFYLLTRRDAANPTLWITGGSADGLHNTKNLQETIHDSTNRAAWLATADGTVPIAAFTQLELAVNVQSGTATYPPQAVDGGRRYLSTASGTFKFDLPGLQPGIPHHIDFWIIVPSFGGAAIDICPSTTSLYIKRINITAGGNIAVTEGAGGTPGTVTSTGTVTDGNPHHVRIVWDQAGSIIGVQIDGGTANTLAAQQGQTTSILAYQVKATGAHLIRDLAIYRRRKGDAITTFTPTTTLTGSEANLIAFCSFNNTSAITLGPVLPQ